MERCRCPSPPFPTPPHSRHAKYGTTPATVGVGIGSADEDDRVIAERIRRTPRALAVSHDFAVTVVDQKSLALVLNTREMPGARGPVAEPKRASSSLGEGACRVVGLEMR